jgi:hypothetical protein
LTACAKHFTIRYMSTAGGRQSGSIARQRKVIFAYIFVAMLYLAVFTPLFIFSVKNTSLIVVHLIDVAVITWSYWYFRRHHNIQKVAAALCVIAYLTVIAVMITGGVQNSGPFLVFPYIPFVVFISTFSVARIWLMAMLSTMLVALLLSIADLLTLPYSSLTFSLYIFNYIIAAILALAYVVEKDAADSLIQQNLEQIANINKQLSTALDDHVRASKQLKARSGELEKLNAAMVNRELKMIELKQVAAKTKKAKL